MQIQRHSLTSDTVVDSRELTDELCEKIAQFNGSMTAAQVRTTLESGQTVYTTFNKYFKA